MVWVDWVIVGLVVVSVLIGLLRGLLREVLSLAGWVVGVLLAVRYGAACGQWLPSDWWPAARTALAAVLIVLACLLVAALAGWALRELLKAIKLSALDRALGGLFGLARAALIIGVVAFLALETSMTKQPFWTESVLLPYVGRGVQAAVRWIQPLVPGAQQFART